MRLTAFLTPVLVPLALAAPAGAAVILPENTTDVTLTSAPVLGSLGLSVAPTGTATIDASGTYPVASFPITGGVQNSDGSLVIEHNGSDLAISSLAVTVDIGNFVITTGAARIWGEVGLNGVPLGGVSAPLFVLTPGTGDYIMTLTPLAAATLNAAFVTDAFNTTIQIGTATTHPVISTAVPEASTWAMLGAGFAALAIAARRRPRILDRTGDAVAG